MSTGGGVGGRTPGGGCEESLARAQAEMADLQGYVQAAEAELNRAYQQYYALLRQAGVPISTPTGGGTFRITSPDEAAGRVTARATGTPEAAPSGGISPLTAIQRQSSELKVRLERVEAKV